MKKNIFAILVLLFTGLSAMGQTANVQIIHNSGDDDVDEVDVWLENQKLVDSLGFREATSYLSIPADSDVVITLQDPSINDTVSALSRETHNLNADSNYVMIISGVFSHDIYDSIKPFELAVHRSRRMAETAGNVDLLFYHGVTDAAEITINETTTPTPNLVDSVGYGEFTGFFEVQANDYMWEVVNPRENEVTAEYEAPFSNLGLSDSALVVVASGFIDTLKSNPGDTLSYPVPKFGLYAALPGGGPLLELPVSSGIGLDDREAPAFSMYPVPADDYVKLKMTGGHELSRARLISTTGKLVKDVRPEPLTKASYELDITGTPEGVYLLYLENDTGSTFVRKLFVEN